MFAKEIIPIEKKYINVTFSPVYESNGEETQALELEMDQVTHRELAIAIMYLAQELEEGELPPIISLLERIYSDKIKKKDKLQITDEAVAIH